MKRMRYAMIGCGAAGKVHAYHFRSDPGIECIAVSDIDSGAVEYYKNHFDFQRGYTNYREMLDKEKLDILSIASPPGVHLEQLRAAMQKGLHIFSEKPLVVSEQEICDFEGVAKCYDKCLGIMLPRRFYNNSLAAKKVIENRVLGSIEEVHFDLKCNKERSYYSSWRGKKAMGGGGVLMSQAIHSIDQLIFLFGKPRAVEGHVGTSRDYIEVEDEAEAKICFESGVVVSISATANEEDITWQGITTIEGTKGRIVLDSAEVKTWDVPGCDVPEKEEEENVPEEYKPLYYGPGHRKVIRDFIASVSDGRPLHVNALDSIASIRLVLGIYTSSARGERVLLTTPV